MSDPTPPPKKLGIIDTNLWLFACASSATEGPENNSRFDRNTRSDHKINPCRLRGALFQLFKTSFTIVPEKVVEELHGKSKSPEMGNKNQNNINSLIQEMLGRETPTKISRADLETQNEIFQEIEARANASLQNPNPMNCACAKTWKKIKPFANDANISLKSCPSSGTLPYTKSLLELEELRRRKKELTPTPEKAKEFFCQITKLEMEARRKKPFLLPDLEILICAEQTKASVFSKDADMAILWACSPDRFQKTIRKPIVVGEINGPEVDFKTFLKETRKSIRKHPPLDHEPEP